MSGLTDDHPLLVEAVREASAIALSHFGKQPKTWEKSPGHSVSEADLAADDHLRSALGGARPGYGWMSEESVEAAPAASSRYWLVDPIDGTSAFLRGRREFSVSVALIEAGRPVVVAVCNPATDELFDAYAGGGVRLNGDPVRATDQATLDGANLMISRTEFDRLDWHKKLGHVTVEAISSIAYKLALVAAGRCDATATVWGKSTWDVAAGDLLVCEAGGHITNGAGHPFDYTDPLAPISSMIAAGGALHGLLVERMKETSAFS
ncbi:MAG: 3'(2'),5'-bisphosphate nucleotidase CysQ [Pseudomonadota bacterium]|nr:3'(2'),5'-bisphosphate nucleotidase CysQ [Pseudomonadota bacterium]